MWGCDDSGVLAATNTIWYVSFGEDNTPFSPSVILLMLINATQALLHASFLKRFQVHLKCTAHSDKLVVATSVYILEKNYVNTSTHVYTSIDVHKRLTT